MLNSWCLGDFELTAAAHGQTPPESTVPIHLGLQIPEAIAGMSILAWRRKLWSFPVGEAIQMSVPDWEVLSDWVFPSYYTLKRSPVTQPDGITRTEFSCRYSAAKPRNPRGSGKRGRPIHFHRYYNCPATLVVKQFDQLVTLERTGGHRDHNHDEKNINEKPCRAFTKFATSLILAGFEPQEIHNRIGALGLDSRQRRLVELLGAEFATVQFVKNTKQKLAAELLQKGLTFTQLGRDLRQSRTPGKVTDRQLVYEQILAAHQELLSGTLQDEWFSEFFSQFHDGQESWGLVFARQNTMHLLRETGKIAFMDSTHNTNQAGWYLFTIVMRNKYGSHVPVAFFLTSHQNSTIITACLKKIIAWAGGLQGAWTANLRNHC
jgi:hypothetical protein